MNGSDNDRQIEVEELLAAEELDPSDFALLNSLRAYYDERDPVPDGLVDRIQFHVTLDALHTEVATLTQLDMAAAGTRSTTTEAVRTITFTSDSLTTMVTLTPVGDDMVRIDGWAAPGAGVRPPTPEWGVLIAASANELIQGEWWSSLFAGLAISLTVFGYAAFGNGLERIYDR